MSRDTGIHIGTLASIFGPAPAVSAPEIGELIEQASTFAAMYGVYHKIPKGAPYKQRARGKLARLQNDAFEKARSVRDWAELARLSRFGSRIQKRAVRELGTLLERGLEAAGDDLEKLVKLYREFEIAD